MKASRQRERERKRERERERERERASLVIEMIQYGIKFKSKC